MIYLDFKSSLYMAMGIPVIVWRGSAMAQYVRKYHLGVCVENLSEIADAIDVLDELEIEKIRKGVAWAQERVCTGRQIRQAVRL